MYVSASLKTFRLKSINFVISADFHSARTENSNFSLNRAFAARTNRLLQSPRRRAFVPRPSVQDRHIDFFYPCVIRAHGYSGGRTHTLRSVTELASVRFVSRERLSKTSCRARKSHWGVRKKR